MHIIGSIWERIGDIETVLGTARVPHQVTLAHVIHVRILAIEPGKPILIFTPRIRGCFETEAIAGILVRIGLWVFRGAYRTSGHLGQIHSTVDGRTTGTKAEEVKWVSNLEDKRLWLRTLADLQCRRSPLSAQSLHFSIHSDHALYSWDCPSPRDSGRPSHWSSICRRHFELSIKAHPLSLFSRPSLTQTKSFRRG